MREDKNRYGRVSRRSSTGTRKETGERDRRERIHVFDDTDDFYQNGDDRDRDSRDYGRDDRRDEYRRDDRGDRRNDGERRYEDNYRNDGDRWDEYRRDDYRREEDRRYESDRRRDDRYDNGDRRYENDRRRNDGDRRNDGAHRQEPRRDEKRSGQGAAPRKQAGGNRKRGRTGGDTERFVHQIVPYAMFWIALFAAVSFVLRDLVELDGSTGVFGNWFADFLCGLLGPAAYLLPLFLVVLSLRWKKFVREGILAPKLLLSTSFVVLLSGIIHVFKESKATRGFLDAGGIELYQNGVIRAGGGFFGGFVGEWLGYILRLPGTILLAIPLLIVVGIYLVGLTPSGLWQRISTKLKQMAERRRQRENAKYDGKEDRRLRANSRKEGVVKYKEQIARQADGARQNTEERSRYVFREEDEPTPPRRAARSARAEETPRTASRAFDTIDIVDIPDDEPEMDAPAEGARTILERAGHTDDSDRKLEEILREMTRAEREEPAGEAEPEEKPLQGSYYAPFALPVRPEPKHERAEAPSAHIVINPHAEEAREDDAPLRGRTTVGPLGTKSDFTPTRQEESLGNSNAETTHAPSASPAHEAPRRETFADAYAQHPVSPVREEASAPAASHAESTPHTGMSFARDEEHAAEKAPERVEEAVPFERVRLTEEPLGAVSFAEREPKEPSAPVTEQSSFTFGDEEDEEGPVVARTEPARGMRTSFSLSDEESAPVESDRSFAQPVARPMSHAATESRPMASAQRVPARAEVVKDDPKPAAPTPPPTPREYRFPHMDLLNEDKSIKETDHSEEIQEKIEILRETLSSFNVRVKEQVDCSRGPTITRYELRPEAGVSVRSVINRIDDISLNLAAPVRIEAPIPGKPAIGIEVPNATRETVYMRTLLESETFRNAKKPLEVPLGLGIGGDIQMCNLAAMPHLLVAGTTGSGKSVCINTILIGLMYKTTPRDLRLILIDPKQIEFAAYAHVPHLYAPIVTESARAVGVLACAVQEMERRYSLIKDVGVRDIDSYNEAVKNDPEREHLPRMVIVIDEFADLKMSCPNNDPENFTCRLAQKARAAGMHLIIGTQRPSVDVITGKLKNNIPSRIAFTVMQQVDSRTILDMNGAESLTGKGDMLYMPVGCPKPARVQGAFVSDGEVERVISYIRDHNDPVQYNQAFMDQIEAEMARAANTGRKGDDFDDMDDGDEGGEDPKFREAVELAIETQKVATSLLQRRLGVGYGRAAKIIDRMEALGYVSAPEGNKARKVLITHQEYAARMMEGDDSEYADDGGYGDTFS